MVPMTTNQSSALIPTIKGNCIINIFVDDRLLFQKNLSITKAAAIFPGKRAINEVPQINAAALGA